MFRKLGMPLLVLASFSANAAVETGKVTFDHGQWGSNAESAGYTFFFVSGPKVGSPTCASYSGGERWVINNNWPAAEIQISILLAASLAGKEVKVRGSGDCNEHSNSETAVNVIIMN